ncbi:MAG: aminopeptidase P family protein [Deltaproteobacteria bacterium]|nr:MAG: aminopeptidase P family protein [Deltaproteobacteria bacterium]
MPRFSVPQRELEKRISELQGRLQSSNADGAFLAQRTDIYYFSGRDDPDYMFVPSEGQASVFFLDKEVPNNKALTPYDTYFVTGPAGIRKALTSKHRVGRSRIGLELDVVSFLESGRYKDLFEDSEIFDVSPLILGQRAVKSLWELEVMRQAAGITAQVFEAIRSFIQPGMTEMELSAEAEAHAQVLGDSLIDIRVRDYKTEGYPWHVLSGPNGGMIGLLDSPASGKGTSAAFPCGASQKRIITHEPIMVDFTYNLGGYHIDETRMFSIGSMPEEAMRASEAAIEIHNHILEYVSPGIKAGDIFDYSVAKANRLGYGNTYLGPEGYQVSFVGHGIGAELIEWPLLAKGRDDVLEPGITFALEPKIVFEDRFIAGVESVVLVTETGCELISKVPVEVFIC